MINRFVVIFSECYRLPACLHDVALYNPRQNDSILQNTHLQNSFSLLL